MSDDRQDGPREAERAKAEQVENNARTVIDDLRAGRVRVGTVYDVKRAVDRAIQDSLVSTGVARMCGGPYPNSTVYFVERLVDDDGLVESLEEFERRRLREYRECGW